MEDDESLTSPSPSVVIEALDNPENIAESNSQEDPNYGRAWNMPAGWVVPGIEHPDDVAQYDSAEDWRTYEADGRKRPRTDDEFVRLFTRAAQIAAVAMSSPLKSENETSPGERSLAETGADWEVSLSGPPAVVFHVGSRTEAMALALEMAELPGERDVQVLGPRPAENDIND